ncbi:hypothetical protein G7Z17_g3094 [Cylindrodendrum hubeiense]|uniref:Uncharacterized protein n=1 Tax=Cylindrodendrum hubeiense TaxID=595255 RepID=A0A9P5HHK4_9HYPO|nr:hypothetical protein G7Z17_g3094 [Cylindrodendrum hubeiense]
MHGLTGSWEMQWVSVTNNNKAVAEDVPMPTSPLKSALWPPGTRRNDGNTVSQLVQISASVLGTAADARSKIHLARSIPHPLQDYNTGQINLRPGNPDPDPTHCPNIPEPSSAPTPRPTRLSCGSLVALILPLVDSNAESGTLIPRPLLRNQTAPAQA